MSYKDLRIAKISQNILLALALGLLAFLAVPQKAASQTAYPISPFIFTTPSPMIGPIVPSSSFKLPSLGTASNNNYIRVNSNGVFFTGGVSSTPSTTPGGSDTQVQVNQNGAFAGYSTFTFNSSTGLLITPSVSSTNALFINASSTNLFASALTFTTASGTSITSTNAFFTNLVATTLNLTNLIATNLTSTNGNFTNLTTTNFFATSSRLINATATTITTTNIYFTNASGTTLTSTYGFFTRVGIGGDYGTAYHKIITPAAYVDALQLTDLTNYTFDAGFDSINGGAFFGGLAGTGMSLWANGAMVMRLTTGGKVGVGTAAPTAKLSVVGDFDVTATTTLNATTTIIGPLTFTTASGTSITSTNAFFTNLRATTLNLTNLVATNMTSTNGFITGLTFTTASGTSITSTNAFFSNLSASVALVTSFSSTNLTSTNGYIPTLIFVSATGTNLFVTNTRFIDATTTNLEVSGQLKDGTGSAGNFGDIAVSTGTAFKWTNLGVSCTPITGDCTVVDVASWFIVSGATGCAENSILIHDDSTYSCDNDFQWDRTSYATKRLVINGDISFLNATGTIGYFSESVSTTNLYADSITTNNLTINNSITVNNLTVLDTATIAASTTINSEGILTNNVVVKTYPENREGYNLTNVVTDPDVIQVGTPLSPVQAFYTDDTSRWLLCSNTTSTGAVSLKNGTLAPNNTLQNAFYSNSGVLQTITASTLFGSGYSIRGCLTMHGYHVVLGVSSTVGAFIKITTSSYAVDISNASNWRTVNFTVATPTVNVISIAGVTRATGSNTEYLEIVSSSTKVVPATWNFAANPPTITPDNTLTCTTGGSATLQNTRAYNGGLVVGNSSAPFVTVYDGCGAQSYNGSFGASAPSLTGPDLAVTKCSIYSLNGAALFRHSGYNGCEEPQF